jgi:hypothetical protein
VQRPQKNISALRGWLPIIILPSAVLVLTPPDWPRWVFMWLLAFAIFAGCKWLTWRRTPAPSALWWQHAGYLLAWPGLDAKAFLKTGRLPEVERPTPLECLLAVVKTMAGIFILWIAVRLIPADKVMLSGWVGMIGLIFVLHFGAFHLLSCAWRSYGIEARPLMNAPLRSVSVSEFWGRRWNTAFRDLTHRFLFRPLTAKLGPRWAIAAGFLFSGLVHDLVISLPARGGYGGPTLFFVVQAVAIFFERSFAGKAIGLGKGWRGWLFTVLVLVIPAYGLFHPPFIRNIIVPFIHAVTRR